MPERFRLNPYFPLIENLKGVRRVRLHAASDLYMKGVTHADVVGVGREYVTLHDPWSDTKHRLSFRGAERYLLHDDGRLVATGRNPCEERTPASVV